MSFVSVYSKDVEEALEADFRDILKGKTYLDHAGATLYSSSQIKDVYDDLSQNLYANPHSHNTQSKMTEDAVDAVRYQVLDFFHTNSKEYSLMFTSGATAALKLVAEHFDYGADGKFAYLDESHTSVLGMRECAPNWRPISRSVAYECFQQKITNGTTQENESEDNINNLFVYPAQCNFSGYKYPLEWIDQVQNGQLEQLTSTDGKASESSKWFCFLDAASFVATNNFNLSTVKPDFVCVSFYKIFGYPTGLGALLVRNASAHLLKKRYFGGGTIFMALPQENQVVHRYMLHEKFEDGTIPFLSIAALRHGLANFKRHKLTMQVVSKHVFQLGKYMHSGLSKLQHFNGSPLCVFYHDGKFSDSSTQGGIVNFNVLRADGSYIGFSQVMHMANLYNISLRTGCFCNLGGCQRHLRITSEEVRKFYELGHVCGDQHDLIAGKPTGSVRVSFGYMSSKQDVDAFLRMMGECFLEDVALPSRHVGDGEPKNRKMGAFGSLEHIFIYPIKSCAAFEIATEWKLMETGLQYDREWMIIKRNGTCLTQKHNTRLCLIRPLINISRNQMVLKFGDGNDFPSITLALNEDRKSEHGDEYSLRCQSKVCGDKIQGWDCGEDVAHWLDEVLCEEGCRLIRQISRSDKSKDEKLALSLANKAQFLLVNKASVQWLRDRVSDGDGNGEDLIDSMARFRGNFVIDFGDAFVENSMLEVFIGNYQFSVQGTCTRCQMICIDQKTGEKTVEPLRTLSRELAGRLHFGVYLQTQPRLPGGVEITPNCRIAPHMKTIAILKPSSTTDKCRDD